MRNGLCATTSNNQQQHLLLQSLQPLPKPWDSLLGLVGELLPRFGRLPAGQLIFGITWGFLGVLLTLSMLGHESREGEQTANPLRKRSGF